MSSIFQVNLAFFQPLNFLSPRNNFQLFQLSTYLLITIISSVKNENFRSTSVFYEVIIKNVIRVHVMRNRFEGNFIQTLLIRSKIYSLFWSDSRSELETPFLIKDFVSICRDLIFFDFILLLFCRCGRLLNNFLKSWR